MMDIALAGTGGMAPLPGRFLTAMLARINGRMILIDCGEGTQITLKELGWGFKNLGCICFTHFHADHTTGLPGLLLTIGNAGRTEPVTILGPAGISRVAAGLCVVVRDLPFQLEFIEMPPRLPFSVTLHDVRISALPLRHGAVCFGYTLELDRIGKFDLDKALSLGLPKPLWGRLQHGEDVEYNGKTYTPGMVLGPPRKGLKAAYITDTRPAPAIPGFIRGSDLFICEGLYGDDDLLEKAKDHRHMIFSEAAALARDGQVGELWLTHFSPAMPVPELFRENAARVFDNVIIGRDRMVKTLLFDET
jgi:ribonuclease Z